MLSVVRKENIFPILSYKGAKEIDNKQATRNLIVLQQAIYDTNKFIPITS